MLPLQLLGEKSMESQGEQNPMCSSSSTIPIEIESRGLMQSDEVNMEVVDETGKRKLSSDAWKYYKVVKLDGARFGVWQWSASHEVCEKLQLFHRITEQFSGSQYPTSTQYFSKVCDINLELEAWVKSLNPLISSMASSMWLKFKKYWDDMHILMGVATIFDPRFKMKLVEFYLAQIYGEETLHKIQEVRNHCFDLFQEYTSRVVASHESFQASSSNEVAGVVEGDRLSSFDRFVVSSSANVDPRSELESYLEEGVLPRTPSFDSLSWWKTNRLKFPTLQKIARDLLAIPISTVASESAFSTSGRLISPHRSRLHPTTLEALMCARTWLWNEINGSCSSIDRVSCPTMLDEEEDPDVSVA